mgnify:CR=1 FL=1
MLLYAPGNFNLLPRRILILNKPNFTLIYPFFKIINYEGEKMYWQNCPMAFGDEKEANWVSKTKEVMNPYLGKNHPEHKATMLHCGTVKDTIKAQ